MHITVDRFGPKKVLVELTGSAPNPLSKLGGIIGLIDWDFSIALETDEESGVTFWDLLGSHDGFPAYEIYINGTRIYEYDPGPVPYSKSQVFKLVTPQDEFVFRNDELP